MTVVKTLFLPARIRVNPTQEKELRKALNLAIVGQENVNEYDKDGKIIGIDFGPEISYILDQAHRGITMSREILIAVDVLDNGDWTNYRVDGSAK